MALPLTGDTLKQYNNLPAIPASEPLGTLLNSISVGGTILGVGFNADAVVDATGEVLGVTLTQGDWWVELEVLSEVVGGSSGNGLIVNNENIGTGLTGHNFAVYEITGSGAAYVGAVPVSSPAFAATAVAASLIKVSGKVQVGAAGVQLRFGLAKNGAPTSVTVKAGSSLRAMKLES